MPYGAVFYMREYYELSKRLYENFGMNRFNYYCSYDFDGTLLHNGVHNHYVGYIELLLADGFDPNMKNRYALQNTPIFLARGPNEMVILSLLQDVNKSDSKENKENKESEEKMEMGSLSLRYDVT